MQAIGSDLAALVEAWGSPVPQEEAAAFLRLDAAKRREAVRRVAALQALAGDGRPSTGAQRAQAERLGISMQRLQALMRAWTRPSISSIVPHAAPAPRRSRGGPAVDIAARVVAKAIARDPFVAEPRVGRRIAAVCSRVGCAPPARMTVRRLLDAERRRRPPSLGGDGASPDASGPVAPGRTLLLTTMSFRARVAMEGGARRAAALVLADAGSGLVFAVDRVLSLPALPTLVDEVVRSSPVLWHHWRRPAEVLLAPPLPPAGGWRARAVASAAAIGVAVVDEPAFRGRRRVAGLHWPGSGGLTPASGRPDAEPDADWPLLDEVEFRAALRGAVDERADAAIRGMDEWRRDRSPGDEASAAVDDLRQLFG